jgi:hypothetical protein
VAGRLAGPNQTRRRAGTRLVAPGDPQAADVHTQWRPLSAMSRSRAAWIRAAGAPLLHLHRCTSDAGPDHAPAASPTTPASVTSTPASWARVSRSRAPRAPSSTVTAGYRAPSTPTTLNSPRAVASTNSRFDAVAAASCPVGAPAAIARGDHREREALREHQDAQQRVPPGSGNRRGSRCWHFTAAPATADRSCGATAQS